MPAIELGHGSCQPPETCPLRPPQEFALGDEAICMWSIVVEPYWRKMALPFRTSLRLRSACIKLQVHRCTSQCRRESAISHCCDHRRWTRVHVVQCCERRHTTVKNHSTKPWTQVANLYLSSLILQQVLPSTSIKHSSASPLPSSHSPHPLSCPTTTRILLPYLQSPLD